MKIDNKGFTLIELLTVIALLGIILLIVTPIAIDIMYDMRRKTFLNSMNGLVDSAKVYYSEQTDNILFDGKTFNFEVKEDVEELKIRGDKPKKGTLIITVDGDISFKVTNKEFCAIKEVNSRDITITDGEDCIK